MSFTEMLNKVSFNSTLSKNFIITMTQWLSLLVTSLMQADEASFHRSIQLIFHEHYGKSVLIKVLEKLGESSNTNFKSKSRTG